MSSLAIELSDVKYRYPKGDRWVLDGINLQISKNTISIITGATGSGKSTLIKIMRGMQKEFGGDFQGSIKINEIDISSLWNSDLISNLAIVFQNPSYQLHQPRVIDELMSAPIYQALPWSECLSRAEQSSELVKIAKLLHRNPTEISVGEQQKVALAASLSMKADIILLDEPFAYLDQTMVVDFVNLISCLKHENKTIVIVTHDLEPLTSIADEIIVIEDGRVVIQGTPRNVLYSDVYNHILRCPLSIAVAKQLIDNKLIHNFPVNWKEISAELAKYSEVEDVKNVDFGGNGDNLYKIDGNEKYSVPVIKLENVSYIYPNSNSGVSNITLDIFKGETLGIIGSNGSGKSTLAKLILGLKKPSAGRIEIIYRVDNKEDQLSNIISYVAQNPNTVLFESTVYDECSFGLKNNRSENIPGKVMMALSMFGLEEFSDRDPKSLSGGQQRQLTLASALSTNPSILIFDEPEFGLDNQAKEALTLIIKKLNSMQKTVILITQELDLATFVCNRIALLYKGNITCVSTPKSLVSNSALLESIGLCYLPMFSVINRFLDISSAIPFGKEEVIQGIISNWPKEDKSV